MAWIRLTPKYGPKAIFNTRSIAYIAAPPEAEAERGIGAGIAMIDNTRDVIPVEEDWEEIVSAINLKEVLEP